MKNQIIFVKNNFYSHIKLKLNTHNDNVMALNYYLNNSTMRLLIIIMYILRWQNTRKNSMS